MFRNMMPAAVAPVDVIDPVDLIPLSQLALDLPAPATGWLVELERRGVEVMVDDIGRRAVTRDVARMLFAEHAAAEARRREVTERNEAAAEEKDRAWRAQLHPGVPWHRMPDGVPPAAAMLQAGKDAGRTTPSQAEWLFGEVDDSMVFHSLQEEGDS
jgi:hypothetical protein